MESPEWEAVKFRFDLEVMGASDDFEQESYMTKQYFQSVNLASMGRTELCEEGPESGSELGALAVIKV